MARITEHSVRQLEPKGSRYFVRDADGFGVMVYPGGSRSFQIVYDLEGKRKRMNLGQYPGMTVAEARAKHREALGILKEQKLDPAQVRAQVATIEQAERDRELERIQAEGAAREAEARRLTVAQWCDLFIEQYARPRKKTWMEDQRLLTREVLPALGSRKLDELKRADIVALLEKIKARLRAKAAAGEGRRDLNGTVANRVHAVVSKMLAYAVEVGHIEFNPATGIKSAKVKEQSIERVLSADEIREVWQALTGDLAGIPFGRDVADVLLMMLATGQRKAEILALRYTMIDEGGVAHWGSMHMKNAKAHSLPLPPLAMAIIRRRQAASANNASYVFPSRVAGKALRAETPNHAVWDWFAGSHGEGRKIVRPCMPPWSPHDLRRTVATNLAKLGISRVVIDRIQAHADGGIAGVYDRHSYLPEMRAALEAWGRRLLEIVDGTEGGKVVPFVHISGGK